MVTEEDPEHDSNDSAQDDDSNENALILVQVLKDNILVSSELLAGRWILESQIHQAITFDNMHKDVPAGPHAICANDSMQV